MAPEDYREEPARPFFLFAHRALRTERIAARRSSGGIPAHLPLPPLRPAARRSWI